ncbi:ATP-binding cassette domain-containing protein, partial [bacterium]|nr:ATP-binding cassette domain-containing protein [bacterium]
MLNIHQLSKSFGPDILLDQISFTVKNNQRLGLVGPNGCGKT